MRVPLLRCTQYGGGMAMYQSSATLESCPFTENRAEQVSERAQRMRVRACIQGCMRVRSVGQARLLATHHCTTHSMEGPCTFRKAEPPSILASLMRTGPDW